MRQEEPGHGDPTRPPDWRKMAPYEWCAASDRLECVGMEATRYRAAPAAEFNSPPLPLTHHRLILFTRPPAELDVRYEGVKRHVPPPAGSIMLVPAGIRAGCAGAATRTPCTSAWSRGWSRGSPPKRSASIRRG
jgi:hypothetical protein